MNSNFPISLVAKVQSKAVAMWADYIVAPMPHVPGAFFVQHKVETGRCYLVNTVPGRERCSCKAHQTDGLCKHEAFVTEWHRIEDAEEIAQARIDAGL